MWRDTRCLPLVRRRPAAGEDAIAWDPERGVDRPRRVGGADAVIHLAGENVFGPLVASEETAHLGSRVLGTRLPHGRARRPAAPSGERCSRRLRRLLWRSRRRRVTEQSAPGEDFLRRVADWERRPPRRRRPVRVAHALENPRPARSVRSTLLRRDRHNSDRRRREQRRRRALQAGGARP